MSTRIGQWRPEDPQIFIIDGDEKIPCVVKFAGHHQGAISPYWLWDVVVPVADLLESLAEQGKTVGELNFEVHHLHSNGKLNLIYE